jgi:hypothetical protein
MSENVITLKARQTLAGKNAGEIKKAIQAAIDALGITKIGDWDVFIIPDFGNDWDEIFEDSALLPNHVRKSERLEYGWDTSGAKAPRIMVQASSYSTLKTIELLLAKNG